MATTARRPGKPSKTPRSADKGVFGWRLSGLTGGPVCGREFRDAGHEVAALKLLSNAIRRLRGHNQLVVESLMVPLLVIVLRVLKDRAPQMGLAQRNQTVQAFSLSRKHKSLRESVQVRTVSR